MKQKPELVTEMIERTYWSCDKRQHRHSKESTAAACLEKNEKSKSVRRWTSETLAEVKRQWFAGMSQSSLARSYGISSTQMGFILWRATRTERMNSDFHEDVDTRTWKVLLRAGARNWADVKRLYDEGGFHRLDGCGPKTRKELEWLVERGRPG